jgi:hypothetical protein
MARRSNKKLNRRDRRARRGKNGQRLKIQDARKEADHFPTLPGRPKLPRDFQKRISAFSASSLFILLFSSQRTHGKRELDSQKEKRTTNRRDTGGRRGDEISTQWFVFWPFGGKNSAVSACSAVRFCSSSPEGAETFIISFAIKKGGLNGNEHRKG